jgi:hypothetical protein
VPHPTSRKFPEERCIELTMARCAEMVKKKLMKIS